MLLAVHAISMKCKIASEQIYVVRDDGLENAEDIDCSTALVVPVISVSGLPTPRAFFAMLKLELPWRP